jgi:hypothetical protein
MLNLKTNKAKQTARTGNKTRLLPTNQQQLLSENIRKAMQTRENGQVA